MVADWLVRLQPILQGGELCIRTRALADTVGMLERNEADFACAPPPHTGHPA